MKKIILIILACCLISSACVKSDDRNEKIIYKLAEEKANLLDIEANWKTEIEVIKSDNNVISIESRDTYFFDELNKDKIIQYVKEMEEIISPPFNDEPTFTMGLTQTEDAIILYMRVNYKEINPDAISQSYYEYCFPNEFIDSDGEFRWDEYLEYLESLQDDYLDMGKQ